MNKTEALLQGLICLYDCTVEILFVGTHYAIRGKQANRTVVGIGATIEEAAQDCHKAFQVAEEIDRRIKNCLCCTSRDGKFTCNKTIEARPEANATNSSYWCAICPSCQKAEMEIEARCESAEAARIERDYR
jgi:hypothetical protein